MRNLGFADTCMNTNEVSPITSIPIVLVICKPGF